MAPPPQPVAPAPQIPTQILQLAWLLLSVIQQNPIENAGLLQDLATMPQGRLQDLNGSNLDRNTLSHLSSQLAIMANMLAQSHAAGQEIPDIPDDDST